MGASIGTSDNILSGANCQVLHDHFATAKLDIFTSDFLNTFSFSLFFGVEP